jgi:hypothetical protein
VTFHRVDATAASWERPDGRPVHQYRIGEEELARLRATVRDGFARGLARSLASAFLVWGAETCRRRNEGGSLSWDLLWEALGARLEQGEARDLTREGLAALGRPGPRRGEGGSTLYLRTLAAEGGIPRALMAQGKWRRALAGLVTDLERFGLACPEDHAVALAQARSAELPVVYRHAEFWAVLAAFARELAVLRAALPNGLGPDSVEAWLDSHRAGWREALPLRLDEEAARALLVEAVTARPRGAAGAAVARLLVRRDGAWEPRLAFGGGRLPAAALPDPGPGRTGMRLMPTGALAAVAPRLLLLAEREQDSSDWEVRRLSGPATARIPFPLTAVPVFAAWSEGVSLGEVFVPGLDAIDPADGATAWIAAGTDEADEVDRLSFLGGGTVKVRDPMAFALVAADAAVSFEGAVEGRNVGAAPGATVWELRGEGRLLTRGGSLRIRTGAEAEAADRLLAMGRSCVEVLGLGGAPVHLGRPGLWRVASEEAMRQPRAEALRWRMQGERGWRSRPPEPLVGPVEVGVIESDNQMGPRLRLHLLPQDVRFASAVSGAALAVRAEGLPPGTLLSLAGAAPVRVGPEGRAVLPVPAEAAQRTDLALTLQAPVMARPVAWTLRLTPPVGRFVDEAGQPLTGDRVVALDDLRRWRAVPASRPTTLSLHPQGSGPDERAELALPGPLPLSAFTAIVEELLSLGGPDAEVALRLMTAPDHSPRLAVRRYAHEAVLEHGALRLRPSSSRFGTPADLRPDGATAVDLHDPARVVALGEEALDDPAAALGPGAWFLLPRLEGRTARPPRPLTVPWPEGADRGSVSPAMRDAALGPTREARRTTFARHLCGDPPESDLDALGRLVDTLGDLGASTSLDQVQAVRECPTVAVRLLLRAAPGQLAGRLALEAQGGPSWVLTPPLAWAGAIRREVGRIEAALTAALPDQARAMAEDAVRRQISDILLLRPELAGQVGLGLLDSGVIGVMPEAFARLRQWMGQVPRGFVDPEAALVAQADRALRRHADAASTFRDLRARRAPVAFARFGEDASGLIEAPLVIAEHALGLRPLPGARERGALLRYAHHDQAVLIEVLPAALAWRQGQPA